MNRNDVTEKIVTAPIAKGLSRADLASRVGHEPDPKGDRLLITMSGNFLPCKMY